MAVLPDINRDFQEVWLEFIVKIDQDTFADHNAVIVADRLRHYRYQHLADEVNDHCPCSLGEPLGLAMLRLKHDGNPFSRWFLNDCGAPVCSECGLATPGLETATRVCACL